MKTKYEKINAKENDFHKFQFFYSKQYVEPNYKRSICRNSTPFFKPFDCYYLQPICIMLHKKVDTLKSQNSISMNSTCVSLYGLTVLCFVSTNNNEQINNR